MYPNLYYLLYDIFGVDIEFFKIVQSFGLMVALSFIAASVTLSMELKRKTKAGLLSTTYQKQLIGEKVKPSNLIFSGIYGFILGYKLSLLLTDYTFFISNPQDALLSLKGNWIYGIGTGVLFTYLKYREKKKEELPEPQWIEEQVPPSQHVGNMTVAAAIGGIIGAKLFHLLENPDQFATMFSSSSSFFSGLTMYGGLIVGGAAVIWYAKKNNLTIKHIIDSAAPGLMLAYGIGRIGCHIAGDGDWGIANTTPKPNWLPDWLWSYSYPNNVNGVLGPQQGGTTAIKITNGDCYEGFCTMLDPGVYPTSLYEFMMCMVLFVILWFLRKRIDVPGIIFSLYLIFNGIERFTIEKIRVNERLWGTNITQAEIISSFLVVLGFIGIWYFNKIHKNETARTV